MKRVLFLILCFSFFSFTSRPVVDSIKFVGLKRVKVEAVRKELLFKEGDVFTEDKLERSIRNLMNTHLFYSIKSEVSRLDGKVVVKLKFKERKSFVPLPKLKLKSNGSLRVGFEIREYNFLGRAGRLSILFTKWLGKLSRLGSNFSVGSTFYRIGDGSWNLIMGFSSSKSYDNKAYLDNGTVSVYDLNVLSLTLGLRKYLDVDKVKSFYFALNPCARIYDTSESFPDNEFSNNVLAEFKYDKSTDHVHYVSGYVHRLNFAYSEPIFSDVSSGSLKYDFVDYMHFYRCDNLIFSFGCGTKFGYSGYGDRLDADIPGYGAGYGGSGKRYIRASSGYRFSVVDKTLFVKPSVVAGDGFDSLPDNLLVSFGLEAEALWGKLSDGMIKFKVYKGAGEHSETKTTFKFAFRW